MQRCNVAALKMKNESQTLYVSVNFPSTSYVSTHCILPQTIYEFWLHLRKYEALSLSMTILNPSEMTILPQTPLKITGVYTHIDLKYARYP